MNVRTIADAVKSVVNKRTIIFAQPNVVDAIVPTLAPRRTSDVNVKLATGRFTMKIVSKIIATDLFSQMLVSSVKFDNFAIVVRRPSIMSVAQHRMFVSRFIAQRVKSSVVKVTCAI